MILQICIRKICSLIFTFCRYCNHCWLNSCPGCSGKINGYGDLRIGYGLSVASFLNSFSGAYSCRQDVKVLNAGVSGDTTAGGLARRIGLSVTSLMR